MNGTTRYITLLLSEMSRHRAMAKIAESSEIKHGHMEAADACWAGAEALKRMMQIGSDA